MFGNERCACDTENGDLLAWERWKGLSSAGRCEGTVVGVHGGLNVELLQIESHERDVSQRMVFAQTRTSDVGN